MQNVSFGEINTLKTTLSVVDGKWLLLLLAELLLLLEVVLSPDLYVVDPTAEHCAL